MEEGIRVSRQGVRMFLKHFNQYGTIAQKPGSGAPPRLSPDVQQIIEDTMRNDDEITTTQLQAILASHEIYVSLGPWDSCSH